MMNITKRLVHLVLWGTCALLPLKTFALESIGKNPGVTDKVSAWIKSDLAKRPVSIGLRIPGKIIDSPPAQPISVMIPRWPHVPFKHVYFSWEPQGHDPTGIYNVPHFDIHFYLLSNGARKAITCAGTDQANCMKPIPAGAVPTNYAPTPEGVPKMGWHWVDLLSPEFHSQPFTATMIYGYYNGQLAFIEPMITQAFFQSRQPFSAPIRQPLIFPKPGYYPTRYKISYTAVTDLYEVDLTNLVYRR